MASVGGEQTESLTLNLTPMLDIFRILVCFLLMSYSTDPVNHDVDTNLELPESATLVNLDEIPAIVVNRKEILVNNKKITSIVNGDVVESDRAQGAIMPLFKELEKLAEMNKKARIKAGVEVKEKLGTLAMEMDKEHRFKLMKRVMLSAQQAEFINFKLLVEKTSD